MASTRLYSAVPPPGLVHWKQLEAWWQWAAGTPTKGHRVTRATQLLNLPVAFQQLPNASMSATTLHLASSKSFSSPASSTVWWLWSYTFYGHPIRRCSWSSGELHCRLGRRFEHHLFLPRPPALLPAGTQLVPNLVPWPCLTSVDWWCRPFQVPAATAWLNAQISFCRRWKTIFSPCRVIHPPPWKNQ